MKRHPKIVCPKIFWPALVEIFSALFQRDKPHMFDNDDDDLIAKLDFTNATLGNFDTPHNNKDMGPLLHHNNNDIASRNIPESQNPHRLFGSLLDEKLNINGRGDTLMSNHNPKGMDNISQTSLLEHKDQLGGRGPFPPYQKDFGPPGSNVPPISSKVVGSGSAYPRMQDDFAGGARSGFDLQTDMLARAPHRGDVFAGHQGRPNSGMGNDGRLNIGEVRARNQGNSRNVLKFSFLLLISSRTFCYDTFNVKLFS